MFVMLPYVFRQLLFVNVDSVNSVTKYSGAELEPVNETRKHHLTTELMPRLDEQIVTVTRKRKSCPSQCARHLAKQCKHECLRMVSAKEMLCIRLLVDNVKTQEPLDSGDH